MNTETKSVTADPNSLIDAAEREIARVLAKLESDTGMVLNNICVRDTDVTQIQDVGPRWLRRVVIEMNRLPGTRWRQ